jgi:hypothetical protein
MIIESDSKLTGRVEAGVTGALVVYAHGGKNATSSQIFTYTEEPNSSPELTISSFTPISGGKDTRVTISGEGFTATTAVRFGNTIAADWNVESDTMITAVVGDGSTGPITVSTPEDDAASSQVFTYTEEPDSSPELTISSFIPMSGDAGTVVTITGSGFNEVREIHFGDTPSAGWNIDSDTRITAEVGLGSTGHITLFTPGGTAISSQIFTYIESPVNGGGGDPPPPPPPWGLIIVGILVAGVIIFFLVFFIKRKSKRV